MKAPSCLRFLCLPLAGLSLLLPACGGVASDFAGTWSGVATLSLRGYNPYFYATHFTISVADGKATFSNICPGGDGLAVAEGNGRVLGWEGSLLCQPVQFGSCNTFSVLYKSAHAQLENEALHLDATAETQGCGGYAPATLSFDGQR